MASASHPGEPAAVHRSWWKPHAAIHQDEASILDGADFRGSLGCMEVTARHGPSALAKNMREPAHDGGDAVATGPSRHCNDLFACRPRRLDMACEPRPLLRVFRQKSRHDGLIQRGRLPAGRARGRRRRGDAPRLDGHAEPRQKSLIDEINGHRVTDGSSRAAVTAMVADCRASSRCRSSSHAAVHVPAATRARTTTAGDLRGLAAARVTGSLRRPGAGTAITVGNVAKTSIVLVLPGCRIP